MMFIERREGQYYLGGTQRGEDAEMIVACVNLVAELANAGVKREIRDPLMRTKVGGAMKKTRTQCLMCDTGTYQDVDVRGHELRNKGLGLARVGSKDWQVVECDACHNVQIFQTIAAI